MSTDGSEGYQRASSYYQQARIQEQHLEQQAFTIAQATGEDRSKVLLRWKEAAYQQTRREVGEQKMQATDVYSRMAVLAQSELAVASAQQGTRAQQHQQPSAAQFQQAYHDKYGEWPSIAEQRAAGVLPRGGGERQ